MAIYAIGDIQGCYDQLVQLLGKIGFNDDRDQIWFTGDLVNRGPHSLKTLRMVRAMGANAITVLGNHDLHLLAVACKAGGLTWTNFYAAQIYGQVAYHDFEGVTVNPDEKARLLASLGDKRILILRNHGLLAWGETIAEALVRLWTVERACQIQLASDSMAGETIEFSAEVGEQASAAALQFNPDFGAGADVFAALKRVVDAKDPSYRT